MSLNLIKAAFVFNALSTGVGGLLINFFEGYLPASFSKLYRHGKFCANVKDAILDRCEVPKKWFKHFYAFAGPLSTFALVLLYRRYFLNASLPDSVINILHFFCGPPVSLIPAENVILAMTIFTIHCWKRFYESHFISVFSDVRMNFSIYLIGLFHYFGTVISLIGESNNLTTATRVSLNWTRLSTLDYACSVVFLVSTYLQYRSNIILSNLRKDKNGSVVTKKYKIPRGELFDYVSGPLQLTEIILYVCLALILRNGSMIHYVLVWVIINQVECAYLTHQWSMRTFSNYPQNRKIIVPFIF